MLTSLHMDQTLDRIGVSGLLARMPPEPPTTSVEIEPEIVLPVQFDEFRRNGAARPPEHMLLLAVLEDAVHTYQVCADARSTRRQRLLRETEDWFASEETTSPFSFVTICQVWSLDPDYVRKGLRRWRARRLTGSPVMPFRIRHVSGSRHQVTMSRAARRGP